MKRMQFGTAVPAVLFAMGVTLVFAAEAAAQREREGSVPKPVERAVQQRYPNARVGYLGSRRMNGVETYHVRIAAPDGETTARATEQGEFLFLGYPGVTYDRLPRQVTNVLDGMFRSRAESVQKYERTTYLINADLAGQKYVVQINPVGRLVDIKPFGESINEDLSKLPRASRDEEEALRPRLKDYFTDPRVKSVYRYPGVEDYYWVELSTQTEDYVRVLMNTRRDVARYSTRVSRDQLPQAVKRSLEKFFPRADVDQIYRHNEVYYNVVQDAGDGDAILLAINPLGNVIDLRQADAQDIRREFNAREPDVLFERGDRD